ESIDRTQLQIVDGGLPGGDGKRSCCPVLRTKRKICARAGKRQVLRTLRSVVGDCKIAATGTGCAGRERDVDGTKSTGRNAAAAVIGLRIVAGGADSRQMQHAAASV